MKQLNRDLSTFYFRLLPFYSVGLKSLRAKCKWRNCTQQLTVSEDLICVWLAQYTWQTMLVLAPCGRVSREAQRSRQEETWNKMDQQLIPVVYFSQKVSTYQVFYELLNNVNQGNTKQLTHEPNESISYLNHNNNKLKETKWKNQPRIHKVSS